MEYKKEPVKLRQRKTSKGLTSLYLDIYSRGRRKYEYLHLYLIPEKNRQDKEKNKQTLRLAEAVCAKRIVEIRNHEFGFMNDTSEVLFFDYFQTLCDTRNGDKNSGTKCIWESCLKHMKMYEKKEITLANIDSRWIDGFKEYLSKSNLSINTQWLYFSKLRAALKKAYNDGILMRDVLRGISSVKKAETTRMYLTLDEMRVLADTECNNDVCKRAFLFSCLTGLRKSDVENLTWADVHEQGEFTRIVFRQQKTKGQEYLDISKEAVMLMGDRKQNSTHVFELAVSDVKINRVIAKWVKTAGIDKKITFHCARHSFATLMLDTGTDIYTVSKLLGHSDVATTQIYAKVLDKNKQAAVANMPKIL